MHHPEPIPEQGGQQDMNNLHMEEIPEHRLGKEPMAIVDDGDANLGEPTHRTERLEDVIRAVQMTVNLLNQFFVRATEQGIQLTPTLAGSA